MTLEERMKSAVLRAYAAAGLHLPDWQADSLAEVYADWGRNADERVVERVETALARSLGVQLAA